MLAPAAERRSQRNASLFGAVYSRGLVANGVGAALALNSGTVVAGNVGGAGRLEFSVIGDAVNVAARVESATRETGDTILLAGRTKEMLQHAPSPSLGRDAARLGGPGPTLASGRTTRCSTLATRRASSGSMASRSCRT